MKEEAQLPTGGENVPVTTSEIFQDLIQDITNNEKEWKAYWDSEKPETLQLPG